jgi:GntR family transcriptional regulator
MKLQQGPIPLYYQLETILRDRIASGEIPLDKPFPTELDLCKEFEISRPTVRQAIKALELEGLVRRQRGRGTFVTNPDHTGAGFRFDGTIQDLFKMGRNSRMVLFSKELIFPEDRVKKDMELGPGQQVFLFEGVRIVNPEYKQFFQVFVPEEYGAGISIEEKLDFEPQQLITRVEEEAGQPAHRIYQTIKATSAVPKVAQHIDIEDGDPVIFAKRIWYTRSDDILELVISYIPLRHFQIESNLIRLDKKVDYPV